MANKLSKEQIQKLNEDIKNGTTLTTVHNSRYHLIVKINAEAICVQSMIQEDSDKGILINLKDLRDAFDEASKNVDTTEAPVDETQGSCDTTE